MHAIIDLTAAVQPEFGANALLQLVETGFVADKKLEAELLTRAFYMAESASQDVKRVALSHEADSRAGYRGRSFELNMDRTSLQSRAVIALSTINPKRANALLGEFRPPKLLPLDCVDPLAYDVERYYAALQAVQRNGFTHQERLQGKDILLVLSALSTLHSGSEIRPAAEMLLELRLPPKDLDQLSDTFSNALIQLRGDPRSFAASVTRYDALGPLIELATKLATEDKGDQTLTQSVRGYLVSNFQGKVCADAMPPSHQRDSLPPSVTRFNKWLRATGRDNRVPIIDISELSSLEIEHRFQDTLYWESPTARELLQREQHLRSVLGQGPLDHTEKYDWWDAEYSTLIAKLDSWSESDKEMFPDFFHQKAILYLGLAELARTEREQSFAVAQYIRFLELNSFQRTSPAEWFFHLEDLLARFRASKALRGEVLEGLRRSRDPVLNLYGRLEAISPESPNRGDGQ